MTESEREYLESSDKMMVAGEKALSNPNILEPFKELIKKEMKNQQDLMKTMGWDNKRIVKKNNG